MPLAFFNREGEDFAPRDLAKSLWSDKQMHGVAVSGLLAWGAERLQHKLGREELVPAKFSVDMFRPAAMALTSVRSEEHTSELQSLMRISYAVFCLKKKKQQHRYYVTKYKHIAHPFYSTVK